MSDPWYFEDVAFNHDHADEAVSQLRQLKSMVEALVEVRATAAGDPLVDWEGRFRDDFDREFTTTQDDLTGLCEDIDTLITNIDDGAEMAAENQSYREDLRRDHEEGEG